MGKNKREPCALGSRNSDSGKRMRKPHMYWAVWYNIPLHQHYCDHLKTGAFLAAVSGISAVAGFCTTVAAAKKADPKYFTKGLHSNAELSDAGAILALRALGWGTIYAIAGTSFFCFGVWKLSGAKDLKDFRIKMGNMLPSLPKNDPPQSRTEFSGINDFLTYLSDEYGKKPVKDK